jgi:hypothetical protein
MPEFNDLTSLVGLEDYPLLKSISDKTYKNLYNNGINNFIYSDSILEPAPQNSTTNSPPKTTPQAAPPSSTTTTTGTQ